MEPIDLLKAIHQRIIDFRAKSGLSENAFAKKAVLTTTSLVPIEEIKVTPKGKIRTIDLLTLLKIFNGHPALREDILDYLRGNTEKKEEKSTAATNSDEAAIREELRKLRDEISFLRSRNTELTQAVLNLSGSKVIEQR